MNEHVHPLIAAVLNSYAASAGHAIEIRRGAYVAMLKRQDWSKDCTALKLLRRELDPSGELWNQHARRFVVASVHDGYVVRDWQDGTDTAPFTWRDDAERLARQWNVQHQRECETN